MFLSLLLGALPAVALAQTIPNKSKPSRGASSGAHAQEKQQQQKEGKSAGQTNQQGGTQPGNK